MTPTPNWKQAGTSGSSRTSWRIDVGLVLILSFGLLVWLVAWMDNPQALTANGLFKAMTVRDWIADPRNASLDQSNYLYYPLNAVLCHLLDLIGVSVGNPRRQLAIINCLFAAISLGIVYLLVRALSGRRSVAWAAVLFHVAGAFFLNLSISNEDILPSYAFLLGSMALATVWFARPTASRVAVVSVLFTVAWLIEWRVMFPTLPAMLVALALGPDRVRAKSGRIVLFLVVMVAAAELAMLLWGPQNGNAGTVMELLWTGKGIGSGWGGFNDRKLLFLWAGISEYLLGGTNLGDPSQIKPIVAEMMISSVLIGLIAILFAILLWQNRKSPEARVLAAVFGVTFVAGEFLNLYSQPQDPQMQINVMAWLTIGWAVILSAASRRYGFRAIGVAAFLAVAILGHNIQRMAPARGHDGRWQTALQNIEARVDPERTVFLVHGFEQVVSEMFYAWHGDWTFRDKLGQAPAPIAAPRFKFIALVDGPVHQPAATGEQIGRNISLQIDRLSRLGFDVVADYVWDMPEAAFVSYMSTVADAEKAAAIYRVLHEKFTARRLFADPTAGPFYRLQRVD